MADGRAATLGCPSMPKADPSLVTVVRSATRRGGLFEDRGDADMEKHLHFQAWGRCARWGATPADS